MIRKILLNRKFLVLISAISMVYMFTTSSIFFSVLLIHFVILCATQLHNIGALTPNYNRSVLQPTVQGWLWLGTQRASSYSEALPRKRKIA